jgi:DNA-binding NarL/FixJ family response regulator
MAKKLLIVEETLHARQRVRLAAATPSDTVFECGSPDEALKAVRIFQPDCVVMGVNRPNPGAFQAIRDIRETYPRMRVLALSEVHEPDLQQLAEAAGASGYVTAENISELFLLAAPERLVAPPKTSRRSKSRRPK